MPAKGSKWDPVACRYVSAEELALKDAAAATAYAERRGWELVGGAETILPPPTPSSAASSTSVVPLPLEVVPVGKLRTISSPRLKAEATRAARRQAREGAAASLPALQRAKTVAKLGLSLLGLGRRFGLKTLTAIVSSWAVLLFAFAAMWSAPSVTPHIARGTSALADIAESTARVVTGVSSVATNLTSGLTSLSAYVANGGLSLTEEAWAGIDLLELKSVRDGGRLVADDAQGLAAFLDSSGGRALWRGNAACVAQAQEVLRAVAVERPAIARRDSRFEAAGLYHESLVEVRLLDSGWLAVRWEVANVTFSPRWSNPLWELAGFVPEAETPAIQARLHAALAQLGSASPVVSSLDDLNEAAEDLPVLSFSPVRRLARAMKMQATSVAKVALWLAVA